MQLLTSVGFKPLHVSLNARPTPVDNIKAWVRLFCGHNFLEGMGAEEEASVVDEVENLCREDGRCWDSESGVWRVGYFRLRFVAEK